ncbi:MAG: hypothetical protein ABIH28_03550, partial [archaeon]
MGKGLSKLVTLIIWLTGVLVSLAVGFGMISGALTIPYIQTIVPIAGWIVVILTIAGVILSI